MMSTIRNAVAADLKELLRLENAGFKVDRLSRRSMQRWLRHSGCIFLVYVQGDELCGYILVILRRGTRLARLYSLAVDPARQRQGIAELLVKRAEQDARDASALFMRLEVAGNNAGAIRLYNKLGYQQFGLYQDYYEDHSDALRMEKCIYRLEPSGDTRVIPWISQTTAFTCGPASLMMAMRALDPAYTPSPLEEIQIWREATTIFMTSGHGGCHPMGLALAAVTRGFTAEIWLNQRGPLFTEGVRDQNKKRVLGLVHEAFQKQIKAAGVPVHYADIDQQQLAQSFAEGANVLILISTYRMDRKKTPHWVVLSGYDERCLFVHDPDLEVGPHQDIAGEQRNAMECHHLPIARDDFAAMSRFGGNRLRAAVILRRCEA